MHDLSEILTREISDIDALRNLANCVMRYTEVIRQHNGKGRPPTYAARVDAIAQSARQLAEIVLQAVSGATSAAPDATCPHCDSKNIEQRGLFCLDCYHSWLPLASDEPLEGWPYTKPSRHSVQPLS